MKNKKRFLQRLFGAIAPRTAPPNNGYRVLRVETLETRALLSISLSGSVHLDSTAGTPVRNAYVDAVIPIVYCNQQGVSVHTEVSDSAFTNGSGGFTIVDDGPPITKGCTTYAFDPGRYIFLFVYAVSPNITGGTDDPDNPAYAVLPDQGSKAKDANVARDPSTWLAADPASGILPAFEETFDIPSSRVQPEMDEVIANGTAGGTQNLVHDAFAAFTTIITYTTFATQELGASLATPLPVFFFPTPTSGSPQAGYLPRRGVVSPDDRGDRHLTVLFRS